MKKCKMCTLRKTCGDLPGFCLLLPMGAVVGLILFLGFLFFFGEPLPH